MIKNYLLAFCLGASLRLINAQNMTLDAQRVGIGTNNPAWYQGGGCTYITGTNYPCGYGGAGMIIIRH